MRLKAMTYFNELVRSRAIRQASEKLGVSATAISKRLENLEHYFGAPLITQGTQEIKTALQLSRFKAAISSFTVKKQCNDLRITMR